MENPSVNEVIEKAKIVMRNNRIRNISPEIGYLPKLGCLQLHGNKLGFLPFEITRINKLELLELTDNALYIPHEILIQKYNPKKN